MDCITYKRLYPVHSNYPVPREVWDTPEGRQWMEHTLDCVPCSDWSQRQEVEKRGGRVEDFPCVHMAAYATFKCEEHPELYACSKAPILYDEQFDEYSLGPRGGTGDEYVITHCPWCGVGLPPSQRQAWFDALAAKGIDSMNDELPVEFQTGAWRKG